MSQDLLLIDCLCPHCIMYVLGWVRRRQHRWINNGEAEGPSWSLVWSPFISLFFTQSKQSEQHPGAKPHHRKWKHLMSLLRSASVCFNLYHSLEMWHLLTLLNSLKPGPYIARTLGWLVGRRNSENRGRRRTCLVLVVVYSCHIMSEEN